MSEQFNPGATFIIEAEDLLVDVEESILDLEADPTDVSAINRLFRAMHTIKGSGSMFGFEEIAEFTHHIETGLDQIRAGKVKVTKKLIDLILASRDQIKAMLDEHQGQGKSSAQDRRRIIAQLVDLIPVPTGMTSVVKALKLEEEPSEKNTIYRIRFWPDGGIFSMGMDPSLLLDELRDLGQSTVIVQSDKLPELAELDPEQCFLGWDIILTTKQPKDSISSVFIFVEDESEIEISDISSDVKEGEVPKLGEILVERGDISKSEVAEALKEQRRIGDLLCEKGKVSEDKINSALQEQKTLKNLGKAVAQETIRVPSDKLDQLINLVGELVITQAQLSRIAADVDSHDLAAPVEEVDRLINELRDIALNIRMTPIGSTFSRFRRLVRDLSSEFGRKIQLVTQGAETELDKTVIDRLADPLVHLIRNSIDHGIEDPSVRKEAGKPEVGTIKLVAAHRGANVNISIEDDGKGLDAERIKAKAISKGLIAPDADLPLKEIYALILAPGFSTAEKITSISGRGVGMDVVKREIEALRGSIEISSQKGQGTQINLALPLTLAIIDGLLVKVGRGEFVIPVNVIEECLELAESNIAMDKSRNIIQVRGELVPSIRLREIFGIAGDRPEVEEAVVVNSQESRIGLMVDRVLGDHQTVIKSLGKVYCDVTGISGATILGDGNVALILDVPGLINVANIEEQSMFEKQKHGDPLPA